MQTISLKNFKVKKIVSIIGHYDNINNKRANMFNEVKKFKKYSLNLILTPKKHKSVILTQPNYDISEYIKNRDVDYIPFIKDGDIYYQIYDRSDILANDIMITLNDYYEYKDARKIIENKLKLNDGADANCYIEHHEKISSIFHRQKEFDYTSYIYDN